MLRRFTFLQLLIVLLWSACDDDPFVPAPDDVRAFVQSDGLPEVHRVEPLFHLPDHDILFFQATYGPPQDCSSGCFYLTASGLRHDGRYGWYDIMGVPLDFDPARGSYRPRTGGYTLFPLASPDDPLFSPHLFDELLAADSRLFLSYASFLAWQDVTPEPALYDLALRVEEIGSAALALLVVTHPHAACSRRIADEVLRLYGARYAGVNEVAQEILQEMAHRCA